MTTKSVKRLVLSFAVPSIICMLMTSFYNMADTYFVSRLDTQSIAAIGIVFTYMGIIQAVSFFFGHGSGNYISRELGARNSTNAESMAANGFFTALISVSIIAISCYFFKKPLLKLFGATESILPFAEQYFNFILIGTPFISGSIVLNNQMRLQGNAKMSMIGILSGGILNVALDPIFIFNFNMGVAGAGLATSVSQFLCFCFMLNLTGRGGGIKIKIKNYTPSFKIFREIAAGGLPSLARQGLMFLSLMCLNNTAANYGDSSVASFSVVSRIMAIAGSLLIGFGQGFQPVCGFNYGAKLYDRVRNALKFTMLTGTIYCTVFAICAYILAPQLLSIFNNGDDDLLEIGVNVLRLQSLSFPMTSLIICTNMFLQNIRKTWPAVIVAMARQGLFFIPAVFILNGLFGLGGLAASQTVSDICAFILCVPIVIKSYRELESVLK